MSFSAPSISSMEIGGLGREGGGGGLGFGDGGDNFCRPLGRGFGLQITPLAQLGMYSCDWLMPCQHDRSFISTELTLAFG